MPCIRSLPAAAAALAISVLALPAQAALLTTAYETQLESWLGQGNLDFTNIFTKASGDNSFDFHAAVEGQGATFVLMEIYGRVGWFDGFDLPSQIIGGYNPQSWSSSSGYHLTPNDVDRTAFIYNLSNSTIQRQNLVGQGSSYSGEPQTYNGVYAGPTFGLGHDIFVEWTLNEGIASNYSYGGTSGADEIVFGGPNNYSYSDFQVGELEVYTFAQAQGGGGNVPDAASTLGLLGVSLLGLMALRRRVAMSSV